MPFNTEIRNLKYDHLRNICFRPFWVFSVDFMYYIMRSSGIDWLPYTFWNFQNLYEMEIVEPGPRVYTPHPISVFTTTVRYAVKNIILHSTLDYEKVYEKLVPIDAEDKLGRFLKHTKAVTAKLIIKPFVTYVEVLVKFTYLSRLAVSFYKHGAKDPSHIIPFILADTLLHLAEDFTFAECFEDVDHAAKSVVDWFRENEDEIIDEAFYDEDFDESAKDADAHEAVIESEEHNKTTK